MDGRSARMYDGVSLSSEMKTAMLLLSCLSEVAVRVSHQWAAGSEVERTDTLQCLQHTRT